MITKEELIAELTEKINASGKSYDVDAINHAITFAILWHDGQFRTSGEEYVCHPLSVAIILVDLGMDTPTIEAALLHDVVEDTEATLNDLIREFGKEVTSLVDGVTKIEKFKFNTYEEEQAENIRKMLIALGKDARVIIIKLADRLHNMRTIDARPKEKQLKTAKETLEVYAPIAHRIGIQTIKDELEDLSLRTLDPIAYKEINDYFFARSGERKIFLDSVQDNIRNSLEEYGIHPTVTGRMKSIASTYRKTFVQGRELDQVYDVFAVRVIVDSVTDCYNALGVVHELYRPIPGRFKDYISTPKPNMYQSLHTTVIGSNSIPFEIQIRTWDMHYTAEYGIAAHWKYKAGVSGKDKLDKRLEWVRHFIENQENETPEEIIQTIKTDLSPDEAFIFTPKGDVITLPTGSTIIDFAYAIHSEVGNHMVGAKVDGRIVPLDYKVQTGEIVQIITQTNKDSGPSRDWINVVKTSEARNKMRSWFKKNCREENVEQGKTELFRELSRNLICVSENQIEEFLRDEIKRQHCNSLEDFYASIGYGGILLSKLIPRLKNNYLQMMESQNPLDPTSFNIVEKSTHNNDGVLIEGVDNCLVKFSKCCNPLPGDEIIGYITIGNGVSIHKCDCINVPKKIEDAPEPERWVSAHWEKTIRSEFKTTLYIEAYDRDGLLSDLLNQLSAMHVTICSINARSTEDQYANIEATICVNNVDHLQNVKQRLKRIPSIIEVKR